MHDRERSLRDGGFAFTPRMSKAGSAAVGRALAVWRSYGSATVDGALARMALEGVDRRAEAPASLRLGDIDSDQRGDTVSVTCPDGTAYTATTPAIDASPVSVWEEWREIRGLQHQFPSPRIVAAHLRGQQVRNAAAAPVHLPLFTPIDRWGDCGLAPTALTPAAVSAILAPHLEGTALPHAPLPAPEAHRARRPAPRAEPAPVPETVMTLDPETFGRGLAARRRAATDLAGVTDVLDDVEDRASRLLDDLLRLLDDPDPGAQR